MSLIVSLVACSALVQNPPTQEMLTVHWAGPEKLFVDPKDAGLLRMFGMLDERLAELPAELGGPELPPEAGQLLARLLGGPLSLRVAGLLEPQEGLPAPIAAQLELFEGTPEGAQATVERVMRLVEFAGAEAMQTDDGWHMLPGSLLFGAREDDFVLSFGFVDEPIAPVAAVLPAGVEPALSMSLDYEALFGLVADMAGPGELGPLEVFTQAFSGMRLEMAMGVDDERAYTVVRMPGYAASMSELGLMPADPISVGTLSAVPMDASWALLGATNFEATLDVLLELFTSGMAESGMEFDPLAMLEANTGIDLRADVLAHLGTDWGVYASDSTGGGGVLSMVAFVELADARAFAETKKRVEGMLDELAAVETDGYVRVRRWELDGVGYSTVVFPGLPIPFEPTCCVDGDYFFSALTPQAAIAAVRQAAAGGGGLRDNPRFREQMSGALDDLYGLTFLDTPRLMQDGYGMTSLLCSALVNGTRSRTDDSRDAGPILPPYPVLAAGAKAMVATTRVVGDDLVQLEQADRSMLVNTVGGVGFLANGPMLILFVPGFAAGIAMPMAMRQTMGALEAAEMTSVAADIMSISHALELYAINNGDRYPDTLAPLVMPDENGATYLSRDSLPIDPWGNEYFYIAPSASDSRPRVYTLGSDGVPGGEGEARDLDNHMIEAGDW